MIRLGLKLLWPLGECRRAGAAKFVGPVVLSLWHHADNSGISGLEGRL
jgi:hypothetical protein